jgi:hypothetical protein
MGVARELLSKQYSARSVAAALLYLTSDVNVHERCKEITMRFAHGNSIQEACDAITSRCVKDKLFKKWRQNPD